MFITANNHQCTHHTMYNTPDQHYTPMLNLNCIISIKFLKKNSKAFKIKIKTTFHIFPIVKLN